MPSFCRHKSGVPAPAACAAGRRLPTARLPRFLALAALVAVAASVPTVRAEPLDLRQIPAGAAWFAHLDLDAGRAAQLAPRVYDEWLSHGWAKENLRAVHDAVGLDLLEDVRSLTFFGSRFEPHGSAVLVRARVDRDRLLALLEKNATHRVAMHRGHELHAWTQKIGGTGRGTMTGCFYRADLVVLGRETGEVKAVLDVLDGQSASLSEQPASFLPPPPGTIFEAKAFVLAGLPDDQLPFVSPILRQSDAIALALGENQGTVFAQVSLRAKSAAATEDLRRVVDGWRAMAALELRENAQMLRVLEAIAVSAAERTVSIQWRMPGVQVMETIERAWARRRAERQAD